MHDTVICTYYYIHRTHLPRTQTHPHTSMNVESVYKRSLDYGEEVKKNIQNGGYLYFRIRTTVDSTIYCLAPNILKTDLEGH